MIAFLISAHTDSRQLKRLIEALPDDSRFFIHVDKKSDITQFTDIINDDRICFIGHRCNVVWGSLIEVEYQMELLRAALSACEKFDYLITLSGLDYPVWSKTRIAEFFQNANGKEFISGNDISWQDKPAKLYREYRFFASKPYKNGTIKSKLRVALRKTLTAIGIKKPLTFVANGKQYKLYKGAAWWAISEDMAKYILKEWDTNKELVHYFKTSFGPAETFAQTVVFNTPEYRDKCMLTKGQFPGLVQITPLTYIYYHPVIKILTEEDYDVIMDSGKMFARKLVTGKSDKLGSMLYSAKYKKI